VQAYKFLRMGMLGYKQKVKNQLDTTAYFREKMRAVKYSNGEPFFQICDPDNEPGLPVFACRVNPTLDLEVDDFSIQHVSTNMDALFVHFLFVPLRLFLIFLILNIL
jgi:glutamate/tyrosine decarboxylase-like PLP-dependent enzyme